MRSTACLLAIALGGGAAGLTGCGRSVARARPPVRLTVTAPADGTRVSTAAVTVSGEVSPRAARVLVLGQPVNVAHTGAFSASVALAPGTTIIDVIAGANRAAAAVAAVRVTRYVLISVPNVLGDSPTRARGELTGVGLAVDELSDPNPLRFLLPFPDQVCQTSPSPGTRVTPGSTVTLEIDKICS